MKKIIITIIVVGLVLCIIAAFVGYGLGKENLPTTVKVHATSKLYETAEATSSVGEFLDIFDDVKKPGEKLGLLIDNGGFPYEISINAISIPATVEDGTTPPTRYMFTTNSGETYWIEP